MSIVILQQTLKLLLFLSCGVSSDPASDPSGTNTALLVQTAAVAVFSCTESAEFRRLLYAGNAENLLRASAVRDRLHGAERPVCACDRPPFPHRPLYTGSLRLLHRHPELWVCRLCTGALRLRRRNVPEIPDPYASVRTLHLYRGLPDASGRDEAEFPESADAADGCYTSWRAARPSACSDACAGRRVLSDLSACVGPCGMVLSGCVIAQFSFREILREKLLYVVTLLRMAVVPLLAYGLGRLLALPRELLLLVICFLAMPTGVNTVVFPSTIGKDCHLGAGMALVSNPLAVLIIPLLLSLPM